MFPGRCILDALLDNLFVRRNHVVLPLDEISGETRNDVGPLDERLRFISYFHSVDSERQTMLWREILA
jgi:hypothetical protein